LLETALPVGCDGGNNLTAENAEGFAESAENIGDRVTRIVQRVDLVL